MSAFDMRINIGILRKVRAHRSQRQPIRRRFVAALIVISILGVMAPASILAQDGDPLRPQQWGHVQLHLDEAYDTSTGEGVVIAILDSGIDLDHPDLVDKLVPGWDFIENDDQPQGPFAWLLYQGRWGERQPWEFNGPKGPNLGSKWSDPLGAISNWRESSLEVPASRTLGPTATDFFCAVSGVLTTSRSRSMLII